MRSLDNHVATTILLSRSGDNTTSNGLMPAAGVLMMTRGRLIVSGVEHAMHIFGVNLCLLVLRPNGFIVLQGRRIMNAPRKHPAESILVVNPAKKNHF